MDCSNFKNTAENTARACSGSRFRRALQHVLNLSIYLRVWRAEQHTDVPLIRDYSNHAAIQTSNGRWLNPSSPNAGPEATPMGGKPSSNEKTRDFSVLGVTHTYSGLDWTGRHWQDWPESPEGRSNATYRQRWNQIISFNPSLVSTEGSCAVKWHLHCLERWCWQLKADPPEIKVAPNRSEGFYSVLGLEIGTTHQLLQRGR